MNEASILDSVKKALGLTPEYNAFDPDIIMHINTVLVILSQMGVGESGFTVSDEFDTWSDLLGDEETDLALVKSYLYLKVKTLFDPSASSSIGKAYDDILAELEWRILLITDHREEENNAETGREAQES